MFEFDPDKSDFNKEKHGIDFEEAKQLWKDTNRVEIPAKFIEESRFLLIASYQSKIWSAIFTVREDRIRIISVRRARDNEKAIYFSK